VARQPGWCASGFIGCCCRADVERVQTDFQFWQSAGRSLKRLVAAMLHTKEERCRSIAPAMARPIARAKDVITFAPALGASGIRIRDGGAREAVPSKSRIKGPSKHPGLPSATLRLKALASENKRDDRKEICCRLQETCHRHCRRPRGLDDKVSKSIVISIQVGSDLHQIEVSHEPT
jgi:hypothetical protein